MALTHEQFRKAYEALVIAAHNDMPGNPLLAALAAEFAAPPEPTVAPPPAQISAAEEARADNADAEA
ncbi:MAG: hypothetical protein ABJQ71_22710 [Roseibium sp.]